MEKVFLCYNKLKHLNFKLQISKLKIARQLSMPFKNQIFKKTKNLLSDHFQLLFKTAKQNQLAIQKKENNLRFSSFKKLREYQKKVRIIFLSSCAVLATLILAIVITFPNFRSKAATFGWVQSSWSGGASANKANHATDQSTWTKFSSKDDNVDVSGGDVKLAGIAGSVVQTTDTDFNAGNKGVSIGVSGTGAGASVMLLKANGAACTIGAECASGGCVTTCVPVCSTTTASGQFCAFSGLAYGVVTGADGKLWLDRNLGATRVATSAADSNAYGWYYQWGRATDGHQLAAAATTTTLSLTDTVAAPDTNKFIINNTSPYDWRATKNDNLWQGVAGVNNPCPAGYRLPTSAEFIALTYALGLTTVGGVQIGSYGYPDTLFASTLKLPLAGFRSYSGSWVGQGSYGYYWSSSPSGANAATLDFNSANVNPAYTYYRAYGFSVRCLKN